MPRTTSSSVPIVTRCCVCARRCGHPERRHGEGIRPRAAREVGVRVGGDRAFNHHHHGARQGQGAGGVQGAVPVLHGHRQAKRQVSKTYPNISYIHTLTYSTYLAYIP